MTTTTGGISAFAGLVEVGEVLVEDCLQLRLDGGELGLDLLQVDGGGIRRFRVGGAGDRGDAGELVVEGGLEV